MIMKRMASHQPRSRKHKLDHVLQGTGMISVDGTSNEEEEFVKQPAKICLKLSI